MATLPTSRRTSKHPLRSLTMAFVLPPLPYAVDALEPSIDARTMEIHHGKHHATYVTNLNKALESQSELQAYTLGELLMGMRKWPGYSDLADDTKLEGCWSAVGAEYLRTLCPSEARLMELVEPAGLPPRIMDRKPLDLMPINHGRATLMLPARLNHQRLCVREARDAELEADRQSALEAKVEVAEAKKVAKQDEREAKKLATQVERDRKARENEAIKMTKRDDQKKKKEEKTAARLLSKVSSQGSAQKHKAVTCSNTMGCNAVCIDGDDALLWNACGKGSCRLQVCSLWQRSVQECACGSPTNGARLRVISDGRICDRGCVISKLFTADRLAVHSKLLAS